MTPSAYLRLLCACVCLLVDGALMASSHVRAGEPPKLRGPAPLILRQVELRNSDLSGALEALRLEAEKQSGGRFKGSFVLDLPKGFKPPYEITLELHAIPFPDALRCVGDLAGVYFLAQGDTIIVRAKRTAAAAQPAQPTPVIAAASPPTAVPMKELTGALGKPAERVGEGDGVHRAMDGSVQMEQSGHVAHRALDGWSTEMKQKHIFDANCVRVAQCPNGCGCSMCTCQKTPKK